MSCLHYSWKLKDEMKATKPFRDKMIRKRIPLLKSKRWKTKVSKVFFYLSVYVLAAWSWKLKVKMKATSKMHKARNDEWWLTSVTFGSSVYGSLLTWQCSKWFFFFRFLRPRYTNCFQNQRSRTKVGNWYRHYYNMLVKNTVSKSVSVCST